MINILIIYGQYTQIVNNELLCYTRQKMIESNILEFFDGNF
jgi:hypothetical protein